MVKCNVVSALSRYDALECFSVEGIETLLTQDERCGQHLKKRFCVMLVTLILAVMVALCR